MDRVMKVGVTNLRKGSDSEYRVYLKPDIELTRQQRAAIVKYCDDLARGKERKRKPAGVIRVEQVPSDDPPLSNKNGDKT